MSARFLARLSGGALLLAVLLNSVSGVVKIGFFFHRFRAEKALGRADLGGAFAGFTASTTWQEDEAVSRVLVGRALQLALSNGLPVSGLESRSPEEVLAIGAGSTAEGIGLNPADAWAWFKLAEMHRGYQVGRLRLQRLRAGARTGDGSPSSAEPALEPEDPLIIGATRKAVELDPEFYFYHDFLAALFWQRGFPQAASQEVEDSFALMPLVSPHALLTEDNIVRSLPEAALRGVDRARADHVVPVDDVELARADLLQWLERLDDAIASLKRARDEAAESRAIEMDLRIGNLLHTLKRYAESLPYLERVVDTDGDGDLATRALYSLGIGRSRTSNHEAAIEALRTHLAREPDLWRSYVALADAYRLAGLLQDAESLYRLAVGRFPSTGEVHWRWVLFLEQEERIAEALAACDELQRVSPGEPARALADRLTRKAAIGSR